MGVVGGGVGSGISQCAIARRSYYAPVSVLGRLVVTVVVSITCKERLIGFISKTKGIN